jgi:uncharacterized protein (TIGR02145 family)
MSTLTAFIGIEEKSVKRTMINEVKIGNQIWMVENLNVDKFQNGDPIPEAKTNEEWKKAGEARKPAWCHYDNDLANGAKYGKLYNWYAVNDQRGLAPAGYHVSSSGEFSILEEYLGKDAGQKMKSTNGWNENGNGTNSSGFSGLPTGCRFPDGSFKNIGVVGFCWSSWSTEPGFAVYHYMIKNNGELIRADSKKVAGLSVRCLKD